MVQSRSFSANQSTSKVTVSPNEADMQEAVGQWLMAYLPAGFDVIMGQQNQTPSPLNPYVAMEIISKRRLATNSSEYSSGYRIITTPTEIVLQINAFGNGAGDAVQLIKTLWRDSSSVEFMASIQAEITPLYADEPTQSPFTNAEANYEDLWHIDIHFQVNITAMLPQDFSSSAVPSVLIGDALTIVE